MFIKKLSENTKMLQINFIMICIIHKISVLLKIIRILCFLRSIIDFYFFKKIIKFFLQHIMIESPRLEEENTAKDVKNLFILEKLKKETTDTTNKDIRNLFKQEKENKVIKDRIITDIRKVFRLEKENMKVKVIEKHY